MFNQFGNENMAIDTSNTSCGRRTSTAQSQQFPDLLAEKRPYVNTETAAHWLNRRPQTLRAWASITGSGPLTPARIFGRLAWPVADIKRLLNVEGV